MTLYGSDQVLNRGPEGALSFIGSKMINASGTMAQLLATNLYGDGGLNGSSSLNSTTDLDGAAAAINIPANYPTYGGITRTDIASAANTGINAYYAAPSAFSLGAVQTAYRFIMVRPGKTGHDCDHAASVGRDVEQAPAAATFQ